jgi:ectoine hydroxylase-related dioxygenase (phytanoyl-CoA dioxygenase family)
MTCTITRGYGIRDRAAASDEAGIAAESLQTLGYALVDGGYADAELAAFAGAFDAARAAAHAAAGGYEVLKAIDEHNTVRVPFAYDRRLLDIALNSRIRDVVNRLIGGYQVLSQQNGVVNPPDAEHYSQGAWHRDLPYQHVVFSHPMAVNALFCLDPFTADNGATLVLPATHKQEAFPSPAFVERHAIQVTAPRGWFIVLDSMVFHTGGINRTPRERRAVNNVYTSPILRQQIDLPAFLGDDFTRDPDLRRLLGYEVVTPRSDAEYFSRRRRKLTS